VRTELDDLYDDVAAYLMPHWAAGSIKVTLKVQRAIDFLTAYLTKRDGTAPSADIKRAAKAEGVSEGMLTKARKVMRLVITTEDPPEWFAYGYSHWSMRCEGDDLQWGLVDKTLQLAEQADHCDPIDFDPYYQCKRCKAPWPS